jgi:hypothetical protein
MKSENNGENQNNESEKRNVMKISMAKISNQCSVSISVKSVSMANGVIMAKAGESKQAQRKRKRSQRNNGGSNNNQRKRHIKSSGVIA